jgi:hypothetical protein
VRFRQQPGLEHRPPPPDRSRHVDGAEQAIFSDPERHLHEWRGFPGADGVAADRGAVGPGGVVPVARIGWIGIAAGTADHPDRRQQGVQGTGQHRLGGSPAPGDHDSTQAGIHRQQQQGLADGVLSHHGIDGKGCGRDGHYGSGATVTPSSSASVRS